VDSVRPTVRGLGRSGRSLLAVTALLGNGAFAAFGMLLAYSGLLDAPFTARSPLFWGALCGAALAVLVLPDIADAARRSRARWLVVPLVAGAGCFVADAAPIAAGAGVWLWLVLASTAVCALYAVARLLLWRAP
jgi:hypothetical protein